MYSKKRRENLREEMNNRRGWENPVTKVQCTNSERFAVWLFITQLTERLAAGDQVAEAYEARRLLIGRWCDSHQQTLHETASTTNPAESAEKGQRNATNEH